MKAPFFCFGLLGRAGFGSRFAQTLNLKLSFSAQVRRSLAAMGAPMSSTQPVSNPADAFLRPHDGVAISFWIISIAMVAATVFFYAESACVLGEWKTSLHVGGLVTLVAAVHYFYMREYWVQVGAPLLSTDTWTGASPSLCR